jgi:hypothetical protein
VRSLPLYTGEHVKDKGWALLCRVTMELQKGQINRDEGRRGKGESERIAKEIVWGESL